METLPPCWPKIIRRLPTKRGTIQRQPVRKISLNKLFILTSFSTFFKKCFSARDYELDRSQIELLEIIGEGQFGDVHKGNYTDRDGQVIPVAVKTCKPDSDVSTGEKFLEEACKSRKHLTNFFFYTLMKN